MPNPPRFIRVDGAIPLALIEHGRWRGLWKIGGHPHQGIWAECQGDDGEWSLQGPMTLRDLLGPNGCSEEIFWTAYFAFKAGWEAARVG